jgi:hypothetical protein
MAVAEAARKAGVAGDNTSDIETLIDQATWNPVYPRYEPA